MPSGTEALPKSDIPEFTENHQIERNATPPEAPYKLDNKRDSTEDNKKEQNQNEEGKSKNDKNDNQQKAKIFDNKTYVEAPLPKTNPWNKPVQPKATAALTQASQNQGKIQYGREVTRKSMKSRTWHFAKKIYVLDIWFH